MYRIFKDIVKKTPEARSILAPSDSKPETMTVASLQTHMLLDESSAKVLVKAGFITEKQFQDALKTFKR